MKKEALLEQITWNDSGYGTANIYVPFFDTEVEITIFPEEDKVQHISDHMMAALNDFLSFSETYLPQLQQQLHAHCELCFDVTEYGITDPKENETHIAANMRAFGIYTPEDAFKSANLESVSIYGGNDRYKNRYINLQFYPEWEDEHGCDIVLQNGIPFGWRKSIPEIESE